MNKLTLEVATYYEPRIRKAALATGCLTLHDDADRLLHFTNATLEHRDQDAAESLIEEPAI